MPVLAVMLGCVAQYRPVRTQCVAMYHAVFINAVFINATREGCFDAPNSQSVQVLARNCWHAAATLQSLQSSKMAGPSTGPMLVACESVVQAVPYAPMKMVQLTQLVTSTSDAWSSTYTLRWGCHCAKRLLARASIPALHQVFDHEAFPVRDDGSRHGTLYSI